MRRLAVAAVLGGGVLYVLVLIVCSWLNVSNIPQGKWHATLRQTEANPCPESFKAEQKELDWQFVTRRVDGAWELETREGRKFQGLYDEMNGLDLSDGAGGRLQMGSDGGGRYGLLYFPRESELKSSKCLTRFAGTAEFKR